ncbi:succinate dehydrogenase assembly factor 2 [Hydrogenophaga sp. MI9]|uniref:FAD assembly factor SdhE n=1 Tax=Hydrogenophaga sp. MI9 TaxID=3453719 RepID=UPI003EF02D36
MTPMATTDIAAADALLDLRGMSKLKWRCRRGLLENDLFIERFFARHESGLTVRQAEALGVLMDLSDNDLLDQLLGRKTPEGPQAEPEVLQVLEMLRAARSTD